MMQSCFGHHFMLVLEKQEKFDGHQQFFAIVQLIGTRKQAENFAYRFLFCPLDTCWPSLDQIRAKRPPTPPHLGSYSEVQSRKYDWVSSIHFYLLHLVLNLCLFRSIHEGVSSAIMNSDCLVFDTSIAQVMLYDPCALLLKCCLFSSLPTMGILASMSPYPCAKCPLDCNLFVTVMRVTASNVTLVF